MIIAGAGGGDHQDKLGDGGPATQAQRKDPAGLAVDALGNLYIADTNDRIRKVDAGGIITTVAGTGTGGFRGGPGPRPPAQAKRTIRGGGGGASGQILNG